MILIDYLLIILFRFFDLTFALPFYKLVSIGFRCKIFFAIASVDIIFCIYYCERMEFISKAKISAIGAYVPDKKLSNHDLEQMVDTTDEWIVQRTGIRERRITEADVYASHLGILAIKNLQENHSIDLNNVDMIICSTFTPDFLTPNVASLIHGGLGFRTEMGSMDVSAACSGFVYALNVANSFISTGMINKALVVATETLSKIVDYTDRNTCVLFGDGASAFLVERTEDEPGFISHYFSSYGQSASKIYCSSLAKTINNEKLEKEHLFWQDGRAVYSFAIKEVPIGIRALLKNAGKETSDIDWFVPHSANVRIISSICDKINIPYEKTLTSVEIFGNTSSVSIPLAIWLGQKENKLKKGDLLALFGFGGGLSCAGLLVKW